MRKIGILVHPLLTSVHIQMCTTTIHSGRRGTFKAALMSLLRSTEQSTEQLMKDAISWAVDALNGERYNDLIRLVWTLQWFNDNGDAHGPVTDWVLWMHMYLCNGDEAATLKLYCCMQDAAKQMMEIRDTGIKWSWMALDIPVNDNLANLEESILCSVGEGYENAIPAELTIAQFALNQRFGGKMSPGGTLNLLRAVCPPQVQRLGGFAP